MGRRRAKAKWIWIRRHRHTVDYHLRARRAFTLARKPAAARLRVTACGAYVLYVNGRYVGSGPAPSEAGEARVDEYAAADLNLARGRNVIAVLAHNLAVGTARRPRRAGGLWLELDVAYERGGSERIVTDRTWRVAPADDFHRRAPRLFRTAGFIEVRDTRREPVGWTETRFRDRRWPAADEVRAEGPGDGAVHLSDRGTPRLAETFVRPLRVAGQGRAAMPPGRTAIPFEFAVLRSSRGEFYAGTFVHAPRAAKARMAFACDEAATVFVNNRQVLRQGHDEAFIRALAEAERNDYAGLHRGQGVRVEKAEVALAAGWNSLGIVLYDPVSAWGFAMAFEDTQTGRPLDLAFSPDQRQGDFAHWHIVTDEPCPFRDGVIPETPAPNAGTFPDPAYQWAWERHARQKRRPRGAAALLADPTGKGPLVLADGATVRYDFGDEVVGCIEVDVAGPPGAILDLAWAEGPTPPGGVPGVRDGVRQVDRLILRGGRQRVRLAHRRVLRHLALVARTGGAAVEVHALGVHRAGQAVADPAPAKTGDRGLDAAVATAARTARCCLQQTLEGRPACQAEQGVAAGYALGRTARALWGGTPLEAAALRAFAAAQDADGLLPAAAPSGLPAAAPDAGLLWVVWLADYVAWTGDRRIAEELYPSAARCLDGTDALRDAYGLLENRPEGGARLLLEDGPPLPRGEPTAWQALWVRALGAAADLATLLGDAADAAGLREAAARVARAARERLWDAGQGLFVDGRHFEEVTPTASPLANAYALWGGLATPAQAGRIVAALWPEGRTEAADWGPDDSPAGRCVAAEALLELGRGDLAAAMIRAYWGALVRAGHRTAPERFRPAARRAKGRTPAAAPGVGCHGPGAAVAALVARWVLGVRSGGPGFEPALLAPMPGGLPRLRGTVCTPKGDVRVSVATAGGRRQVRIAVPEGMAWVLDRRHLARGDAVEVTGGRRFSL